MDCASPLRLTKEQALLLKCRGIHFIDDDGKLIPVQSKGLRVGSYTVTQDVDWEEDVEIGAYSDLYGCRIGAHTKIKRYVEIQGEVEIGKFCKIESHVFIPSGVKIGNYVFVGPGVVFTNDVHPKAIGEWKLIETTVEDHVSIGARAVILPGVRLGYGCMVGAGSTVTKSVLPKTLVVGCPARPIRRT